VGKPGGEKVKGANEKALLRAVVLLTQRGGDQNRSTLIQKGQGAKAGGVRTERDSPGPMGGKEGKGRVG